jgi:hypothetical protein
LLSAGPAPEATEVRTRFDLLFAFPQRCIVQTGASAVVSHSSTARTSIDLPRHATLSEHNQLGYGLSAVSLFLRHSAADTISDSDMQLISCFVLYFDLKYSVLAVFYM